MSLLHTILRRSLIQSAMSSGVKRILKIVGSVAGVFFLGIITLAFIGASSSDTVQDTSITNNIPATTTPVVTTVKQKLPSEDDDSSIEAYYLVTKVVDGDTITVSINGKSETLRLIGIDTPETVDPRKPVQCFGKEASNKAKELLSGRKVRIEKDPTQGERDKYDRLLAYVYRDDGLFYNKHMIEQGYAHEYTYRLPYKYQTEFKLAQKSAQDNLSGLWSPNTCNGDTTSGSPAKTTITAESTPIPQSPQTNSTYICSYDAYNCSNFKTQAQAQSAFQACGGGTSDVHKLDRDGDGEVCESLH